jgi:hypothetical protein
VKSAAPRACVRVHRERVCLAPRPRRPLPQEKVCAAVTKNSGDFLNMDRKYGTSVPCTSAGQNEGYLTITGGLFSEPTSKRSCACGCPPRSMPGFLETAPGALSPAKGSLRAPILRWISSRRHWGQLVARGTQTRWPPCSAADPN